MNDDDLNKKIQQIAELLGQDKMPDNVKNLLSVLSGSLNEKDSSAEKTPDMVIENNDKPDKPKEDTDNSELMVRAKRVMDKLSTGNDPRINLLHAIKPFMNNNRQQKIGNCIKILQLASITKLIDFNDK